MIRAVLPGMRARGSGLIINVSSLLGRVTIPFLGPYNASKCPHKSLEGMESKPNRLALCPAAHGSNDFATSQRRQSVPVLPVGLDTEPIPIVVAFQKKCIGEFDRVIGSQIHEKTVALVVE